MLKKKLVILGMVTSLMGIQGASPPAHALLSLVTANPAMIIAGVPLLMLSPTPYILSEFYCDPYKDNYSPAACTGLKVFGIGLAITGLVLLDQGDQAILAFAPITSEEQAHKLNISSQELEVYNHELEELNAVRDSVQAEANEFVARGGKFTLAKSQALWRQHREELSSETVHVVQKIVTHAWGARAHQ